MVFNLNLIPPSESDVCEKAPTSPEIKNETHKTEGDDDYDGFAEIGREIESRLEPGSLVEDIDQAYALYCEYARWKGFSVRKGCQKYFENSSEIRMKVFNCSCEGLPDNKRSNGRLAVYKKQVFRCNCKARLRVMRERDGAWTISVFEKVHNHELVNPDQSYLLRSARKLCKSKMSILEALHSAGIPVTRACKFMERESGGRQNLGFTRTDAYMHLGRKKKEIKMEDGDSNALVQFFTEKSNKDPFFFWKSKEDIEGKLVHFFFRDSRCAIDYEYFGDVISFDTTYKTNKYNMICAPFIGVNHHFHNVMFGLAFLSDESTETFEWLFRVFLEAMHGKEPEVIFSDQCLALMNGVDYTFKSAAHRLCQWHINQNAPAQFGDLNANTEFKKLWYCCMNGCETQEEFEEVWEKMVKTYDLSSHKWFRTMYNLRTRWSSVFTNDRFSAGLHATSRSEVTNRILKDLGSRSNTLYEFVVRYCEVQNEWRMRENAEDALCRGMPGQILDKNPVLTHAAKVYTRNIYKLFEYEAHHSMNTKIIDQPYYSNDDLVFEMMSSIYPSDRKRCVSFNKETNDISCSCRMWESKGVLCRHIFKVFYLMNVEEIPERYILRRWTRECKRRCIPGLNYIPPTSATDNLSGLVFVNNVMQLTYDLAHKLKGDGRSRSRMNKSLLQLREKLLKEYDMRSKHPEEVQGKTKTKQPEDVPAKTKPEKKIRNPEVVKSRGKRVRRAWRKSKLKGPKREGLKTKDKAQMADSSTEVEISLQSPSDYVSDLCREFSSQPSRLNSMLMDVDDGQYSTQEQMEKRFDKSMPYVWL